MNKTSKLLADRAKAVIEESDAETAAILSHRLSGLLTLIEQVDRYKSPRCEIAFNRRPFKCRIPAIRQTLVSLVEDILQPYEHANTR